MTDILHLQAPGSSRVYSKVGNTVLPGLLRRESAAEYCGVGESTWDKWSAAGFTPSPIRIAGAVFWSRHEMAEWCRAGCPARTLWAPVWAAVVAARRTGRPN